MHAEIGPTICRKIPIFTFHHNHLLRIRTEYLMSIFPFINLTWVVGESNVSGNLLLASNPKIEDFLTFLKMQQFELMPLRPKDFTCNSLV